MSFLRYRAAFFGLALSMWMVATSGSVSAATFYVRTTGNDANAGTAAGNALRTIVKAGTLAHAGDTVYVGAGTYSGTVSFTYDGTSANPIEFIADTTGTYTGDPGTVDVTTSSGAVFHIDTDDYITLDGFVITGGHDGVLIDNSTGVVVTNCTVQSPADDGIEVISSDAKIEKCIIKNAGDDGIDCDHGSFDVVNCLIVNSADANIYTDSLSAPSTIWHTTIYGAGDEGVAHNGGTLSIYNSIIAESGDDGLERISGTLNHDYNIVYNNHGGNYDATSQGPNEMTIDPMFMSATNFHLQSGSPAIDSGTDLGVTEDLEGKPTSPPPDIGSYSFGPPIYYVRISGNDTNSGTSASDAFRTIGKAAAVVTEGSTVHVGGGTYLEGVFVDKLGTSSKPILFIADTAGTATGDSGPIIVKPPTNLQYGWSLQAAEYVSLDGFRISGNGMPQANGLSVDSSIAVTIKNCEIDETIHGFYGESSTLILDNCLVRDTTTAGMWLKNVTDSDLQVTDLVLTNNGTYGLYAESCQLTFDPTNIAHWAISGSQVAIAGVGGDLTFGTVTISGGTTAGVQLSQGTLTATGTTFSGSGYGLSVYDSDVTLTTCILSGNTTGMNADQNTSLQVNGSTFTGSTLWGASVTPKTAGGLSVIFDDCTFHSNAGGLALVNAADGEVSLQNGTHIRDNTNSGLHLQNCTLTVNDQAGGTAWRTLRNGYGISSTTSTLTLSNVSVEESSLYGVYCEDSSVTLAGCTVTSVGGVYADAANDSLTVDSSKLEASSGGGWGVARYGGNLEVKNSVLDGFDRGIHLSTTSAGDQAMVNNSTLVNLASDGVYLVDGNATVRNTILVGGTAAHGLTQVSGLLTHSYNLLDGFGTPFSGTTMGANELFANPRFTDAANGDYSLAKGSPAINSGADLTADGVTVDLLGNARPSRKVFEIGAYEYILDGGSLRVLDWQEK